MIFDKESVLSMIDVKLGEVGAGFRILATAGGTRLECATLQGKYNALCELKAAVVQHPYADASSFMDVYSRIMGYTLQTGR